MKSGGGEASAWKYTLNKSRNKGSQLKPRGLKQVLCGPDRQHATIIIRYMLLWTDPLKIKYDLIKRVLVCWHVPCYIDVSETTEWKTPQINRVIWVIGGVSWLDMRTASLRGFGSGTLRNATVSNCIWFSNDRMSRNQPLSALTPSAKSTFLLKMTCNTDKNVFCFYWLVQRETRRETQRGMER